MVGKGKNFAFVFLILLLLSHILYSKEKVLFEIPHGSGPGELRTEIDNWHELPGPITMDEDDNFYICDFDNDRIQVFNKSGKFIKSLVSKTGYNQFIHYENLKVYYSSIMNGERALECYDLTEDSVRLVQYIKSKDQTYKGNPINGSVIINDTFYITTWVKTSDILMNDNSIKVMTKSKLDTILSQYLSNSNLELNDFNISQPLRITSDNCYLFSAKFNRGQGEIQNEIIRTDKQKTFDIMKIKHNSEFYEKPSNFYITKKGRLFGLIPILIEKAKGGMGYDRLVKIKFQMIKFE